MTSSDRWSWAGIGVVGITAALWSFSSLSSLAFLVGITDTVTVPLLDVPVRVCWGLPITVDTLAVVATRVWLLGAAPPDAVQYARRAAWVAIGASIVGNAYHGWLSGDGRLDSVIVSAVPACVIGALVHLAVLASRRSPSKPQSGQQSVAPSAATAAPAGLTPATVGDLVGPAAGVTSPGCRQPAGDLQRHPRRCLHRRALEAPDW